MTEAEFCGNRDLAVKALTGSHNYNLNTPASDTDYKFFVFPTFDDLYKGKMFSNAMTSPETDATCHDVRQLVELVWKANINFIEVLFSKDATFHPSLQFLVDNREEYAKMNLYTFYKATYGMHLMKMKDLHKGTADTTRFVELYGYDTKQACHALRCLYVIDRYMLLGNMGNSLWFNDWTMSRDTLLDVKAGKFTEAEFLEKVNEWHADYKEDAENFYRACTPNPALYEDAQERVQAAVKEHLFP